MKVKLSFTNLNVLPNTKDLKLMSNFTFSKGQVSKLSGFLSVKSQDIILIFLKITIKVKNKIAVVYSIGLSRWLPRNRPGIASRSPQRDVRHQEQVKSTVNFQKSDESSL